MAEEEEEFLTLDDDLEEIDSEEIDKKQTSKKASSKIITYTIMGMLILLILLLAFFLYKFMQKQEPEKVAEVNTTSIIENIREKKLTKQEETQAQKMLTKADRLFKNGQREEALAIYEDLSHFNKALSYYNIGVAKLKDKKYNQAIKSFEKSLKNTKLKCASALNISICYLNLENSDRFKYFLTLSEKYLPFMINQPLYSYYYSLISYYKKQPLESLISIKNPTEDFYAKEQNIIASRALTSLKNDSLAVYYLVKNSNSRDLLSIGLLKARAGEYKLASDSFTQAIEQNIQPLKSNIAQALVKNRLGLLKDCGVILKSTNDKYKQEAEEVYPISVKLKRSLFDPKYAQKEFKNRLLLDDKYKFSLIFYYAPYLAKNSIQTENLITKGAKKVEIDSIKPALGYLNDSNSISSVNLAITEAIKKVIDNKIYEANKLFKQAISLYPAHSTLHYNLALTYAQMFDFQNAYKHFSKSYSLNLHNYKALAFKAFCAKLTNNKIPKKELLKVKRDSSDVEIQALSELALDSLGLELGYLKNSNSSFANVINLLFAYNRNDTQIYKKSAQNLKNIQPKDIVSNIINLDATYDKNQIKEYAKAIQNKLTREYIDFSTLFDSGFLPKELYFQMLNIAGISHVGEEKLNNYLNINKPNISTLQALALSSIYNQNFDTAYKIYNSLIDDYKQKDSHTLFLASIAALASDHHANAVALLELSKLTDNSNLESKYALGLLYQEAKNLEGASIEYKKIGNNGFKSNYFTFYLKK